MRRGRKFPRTGGDQRAGDDAERSGGRRLGERTAGGRRSKRDDHVLRRRDRRNDDHREFVIDCPGERAGAVVAPPAFAIDRGRAGVFPGPASVTGLSAIYINSNASGACSNTGGPSTLSPGHSYLAQFYYVAAAPTPTPTADANALARYAAQLALITLSTQGIDFVSLGDLLSVPAGCQNAQDQTFAGTTVVTVTDFNDGTHQCASGTAEETALYTIVGSAPLNTTFTAGVTPVTGHSFNASGSAVLTSNSYPASYTREIGTPAWGSSTVPNVQHGFTVGLQGTGSIFAQGNNPTSASGSFAESFDGTRAASGNIAFSSGTVTSTTSLYESSTASVTISPATVSAPWSVNGATQVVGPTVSATLVQGNNQGGGGSFTYTYANSSDPLYPALDGTVAANVPTLMHAGAFNPIAFTSGSTTIATLSLDAFGNGTIAYPLSGVTEYVTEFMIQEGS